MKSDTKSDRNRVKALTGALAATLATAAAPAILFAGAGTAQAASWVQPVSDPLGVTVHIHSTGSYGWCEYSAIPLGAGIKPLPVYKMPFYLEKFQESTLWFPGIPTGTTWDTSVSCQNGGLDNQQVLY